MKLTRREYEIAEMIAWGATPDEIAETLFIAKYTVDNHIKSIREKLHISRVTKIAPWYFCNRFNISMTYSPVKVKAIAIAMLIIILPYEIASSSQIVRTSTRTTIRISRTRKNEDHDRTYIFS